MTNKTQGKPTQAGGEVCNHEYTRKGFGRSDHCLKCGVFFMDTLAMPAAPAAQAGVEASDAKPEGLTYEQFDKAYRDVWSSFPSNNRLWRFAEAIYSLRPASDDAKVARLKGIKAARDAGMESFSNGRGIFNGIDRLLKDERAAIAANKESGK